MVVRALLVLRAYYLLPTTDARLLGVNFITEIVRKMVSSSVDHPTLIL